MSLASLADEAKAKFEEFLGGPALATAKAVVEDLKAKLAASEVVVEGDEKKLEAQAARLKSAVAAQAAAELDKVKAAEPGVLAAVKVAVEAVVAAAEAAK